MSTTHSLANEMLHVLRQKSPYIGLLRAVPDKNGLGGEEVNESSYRRQAIAFSDPEDSAMRNISRVDFPTALTNWGNVAAYALYDAESGGNMLWADALETVTPIPVGSHFFVTIEGLVLSVGLT